VAAGAEDACVFILRRSVPALTTSTSPAVISTTPSKSDPLPAKYRWAEMME
jgi:hypothetical protein